jgi:hypothetical protein
VESGRPLCSWLVAIQVRRIVPAYGIEKGFTGRTVNEKDRVIHRERLKDFPEGN